MFACVCVCVCVSVCVCYVRMMCVDVYLIMFLYIVYRAIYKSTRVEAMAANGANQATVFGIVVGEFLFKII